MYRKLMWSFLDTQFQLSEALETGRGVAAMVSSPCLELLLAYFTPLFTHSDLHDLSRTFVPFICTEESRTASNLSVQSYGPADQVTGYLYQLPHA